MEYRASEIAEKINGTIIGNPEKKVGAVKDFYIAGENDIAIASDKSYIKEIAKCSAGIIIVPDSSLCENRANTFIVVENPRKIFPEISKMFLNRNFDFFKKNKITCQIPNTFIDETVKIGANCKIYPGVTILDKTEIGDNVIIYSGVVIREEVIIGNNVIIQPGAIIGSDGFGYSTFEGKHHKVEQLGRVIIEDDVEIGANTTIDRGTLGDTKIGKGTKIDNLVHIAHNVIIGENCIIVAQVGISGSTIIGNNVTLAGQVGVVGHVKVGNNVTAYARTVISSDVKDNSHISGFPAKEHKEDLKIKAAGSRLPKILKKLNKIINEAGDEKNEKNS